MGARRCKAVQGCKGGGGAALQQWTGLGLARERRAACRREAARPVAASGSALCWFCKFDLVHSSKAERVRQGSASWLPVCLR